MADEHRQQGPEGAGGHGPDPEGPESVVLPEHASAYFYPRNPPTSSAHQTIETEAVRLDPAIDPDNAVTRPLNVVNLQPPPWLGDSLLANAPTVLIPVVRQRRRKKRHVAGIPAAAIGAAVGVVYGVSRPAPTPRASSSVAAAPAAPTHRAVVPVEATVNAPPPAAVEPTAPTARPPTESKQLSAPVVPSSRRSPAPRRPPSAAPSGAASAWLKVEPPKVWVK